MKPKKILEKSEGNFRFQQPAVGNEFLVVGYSHQPEFGNASALSLDVLSNEKPDILTIKLSDATGNPLTKPMAYGQKVNVHVNTSGMIGHKITLSL